MKLEQSFDVHAPIDVVWRALNDLERVAPCLPGATITGHDDDGTYHGEFKVKLGPTTAAYRGTIKITASDESTHTATLSAKGSDKRGQGGANATIVNTLSEVDGATRVNAMTDFAITGRLARFGRGGMIQDISNKLLENFAACLATRLAEGDAPAGAAAPETNGGQPAASGGAVTAGKSPPEAAGGEAAASGGEVTAGEAPPEAAAPAAGGEPAASGGDVATGDAAPEAAAPAAAGEPAATGGEVAAGDEAPEAAAPAASGAPEAAPSPSGGSPAPSSSGGTLGGGPPPSASWSSSAPPTPAAEATAASRPAQPLPAPAGSNEPLKVGGLFWSVLWERIKRLFGGGRK